MNASSLKVSALLGAVIVLVVAGSAYGAGKITPGLYKIVVTMQTPDGREEVTESETCLTQEDVDRGPNPMPSDRGFDEAQCTTERYDFAGGTLDMEMRCSGERGNTVIIGKGVYSDDSFTMTNEVSVSVPDLKVDMKMKTTSEGTRQGDC